MRKLRGPHSAAYRKCPHYYTLTKKALTIRAVEGMNYAAALMKGREQLKAAEETKLKATVPKALEHDPVIIPPPPGTAR